MKSTPAGVERDLREALERFGERASAIRKAHDTARREIQQDVNASDYGKRTRTDALTEQTRSKLADLKKEQLEYVAGLRDRLERELLGDQPSDANSVLLRRDAADRARKLTDEKDALAVLSDAARSGDTSLMDALGYRARNSGWTDLLDAYREARPESADTATALATVEGLSTDGAYNLTTSMRYAMPS